MIQRRAHYNYSFKFRAFQTPLVLTYDAVSVSRTQRRAHYNYSVSQHSPHGGSFGAHSMSL